MRGVDNHGEACAAVLWDLSMDWRLVDNCFLSFSFFPMKGKETYMSLTVDAIVASSCSIILIFFFFQIIEQRI